MSTPGGTGGVAPGGTTGAGAGALPGAGAGSVPGSPTAADAFATAEGGAGPGFGGSPGTSGDIFPMIGDQSAFRFKSAATGTGDGTVGPPPPPGQRAGSLFFPSTRNFKISENMSPRPQDRVFYSFNYYDNLNATINRAEQVPIANIKAYRHIFGFEKTFFDGQASLGLRLPLNTVTADGTPRTIATPTSTSLGNLTIFGKYILAQNRNTGSLASVGLAITPPTGPSRFAGSRYLFGLNSTYIQPSFGYIINRGRFYLHGFSAFDFPTNPQEVSLMYNDVGIGYYLLRSADRNDLVTGVAPTFELHVNTPLNHRDPFNILDIAGTPDVVNLTYGLNVEFHRRSVLTFALINPVTSPKPFDLEWAVLFNVYFGRTRANPIGLTPPSFL